MCTKRRNPPYLSNRKGSRIDGDPGFDFLFDKYGEVLLKGTTVKRTEYAQVLKKLADNGTDAFYSGDIAEGIVKAVQAEGGSMTLEDLAGESLALGYFKLH